MFDIRYYFFPKLIREYPEIQISYIFPSKDCIFARDPGEEVCFMYPYWNPES